MRVALVTGCLKLGGSTTFLCNFAGELIRRGIPALVISFEQDNPLATDFSRQGIPVVAYDHRRVILEDRLVQALAELRRFQPTVVVSTLGTESFEVLRYLPAGIFRVGMGQSDDPPIYPGIARYAACMDMVAGVSRIMKAKLEAQPPLARHAVHYLPYGVPIPSSFHEPHRPVTPSPLRILYLGRLEQEQKRVRLFPQILGQLTASGISFHWTIAGDGSAKADLEAAMQSRPEQTVAFPGAIAYEHVSALLHQHDIYLLASDYEGLPLSLLEAMGHGLVPVVSNLPSGIPEVVDDTNGSLVPVNEIDGYAKAIIHLHHHREELAAKSAAARRRVEREFSVVAMTDRWLAVLPTPAAVPAIWPDRWRIQPPIPVTNKLWYSPPMRMVRRLRTKICARHP